MEDPIPLVQRLPTTTALETEICIVRLPETDGYTARRQLTGKPQRPFVPFALLIWGARANSRIFELRVGLENQLLSALPAHLFEADIPWLEFLELLSRRRDGNHCLERLRPVGVFFQLDLPEVCLGSDIELELEGAIDHAVFIGKMPMLRPEAA